MSSSDSSTDSKWTKPKSKTARILKTDKKYPQKFRDQWLDIFKPWLIKDEQNKPYCMACDKSICCKVYHISQHEGSAKHCRNVKLYGKPLDNGSSSSSKKKRCESMLSIPQNTKSKEVDKEPDILEDFKIDFLDNDDNLEYVTEFETVSVQGDGDGNFDCDMENVIVNKNNIATPTKPIKQSSSKNTKSKNYSNEILLQIQKDKSDLWTSCSKIVSSTVPNTQTKDNLDHFFDSITSSVKALSPKLIVEAKMRICKVVCDLELRAITEKELNLSLPDIDINEADIATQCAINELLPQ